MEPERALAPSLLFDRAEPFLPTDVAVTVATSPTPSPSFPTVLSPVGDVVVEYALWWDMEIGHVYELEHIWVHGRRTSTGWEPVTVEGSAHGGFRRFDRFEVSSDGRPVVYLEPGKHGTAANPDHFAMPRDVIEWLCGPGAGRAGVLVTDLFAGVLRPTPADHRRARRLLAGYSFEPTWNFDRRCSVADLNWVSWEHLAAQIPAKVFSHFSAVNDDPLLMSCGPLGSKESTVVTELVLRDGSWFAGDVPLDEFLLVLRRHRQELVAGLRNPISREAANELAATLRRNWCVTATLAVVDPGDVAAVQAAGIRVAIDRRGSAPKVGEDWVLVDDPTMCLAWRTIGPGGDIDLADLTSLRPPPGHR